MDGTGPLHARDDLSTLRLPELRERAQAAKISAGEQDARLVQKLGQL
jgi:hypothetical protein